MSKIIACLQQTTSIMLFCLWYVSCSALLRSETSPGLLRFPTLLLEITKSDIQSNWNVAVTLEFWNECSQTGSDWNKLLASWLILQSHSLDETPFEGHWCRVWTLNLGSRLCHSEYLRPHSSRLKSLAYLKFADFVSGTIKVNFYWVQLNPRPTVSRANVFLLS